MHESDFSDSSASGNERSAALCGETDPSKIRKHFSKQPVEDSLAWLKAHGSETSGSFRVAAWCGISEAARGGRQLGIAEDCISKARALAPSDPIALFEQSLLRVEQNRYDEALELLDAIDRNHRGLWIVDYNRAVCLQRTGQHGPASELYQQCLQRRPGDTACKVGLANCLATLKRWETADALLESACRAEPRLSAAWLSRVYTREAAGDWAGAIDCCRTAVSLDNAPGTQFISALLLPAIPDSAGQIDEARERLVREFRDLRSRRVTVRDPAEEIGKVPFYLAYHDKEDLPVQKLIAETMLAACPELGCEALYSSGKRDGRIRLGVVSMNLKAHTIGKLNVGLLTSLPDDFELVVFRPFGQEDAITRRIDERADAVIALPALLSEARECIGRSGCDILFFPDLGMDSFTWFLAFARMAPVQLTTWGHPDTTGIPNIDFFVSSRWYEPADAAAHYSERLLLSDELNPLYPFPDIPRPGHRSSIGLPENGHLYVFAQSLFKIHPDFDPVLAAILETDSMGKLVLLGGLHPEWGERIRRRICRSAPHLRERIFSISHLPFNKFLTLLQTADVLLDAPQFCGGNTTYEAFAAGVPVITQEGRFLRGRLTSGMYQRIGWDELVAKDSREYVQLAVRMATDRTWREQCRNHLRESRPVLFDNRAAAEAMVTIFRELHSNMV